MLALNSDSKLEIFDNSIKINKDLPKYKEVLDLMKRDQNIVDYVSYETILSDGITGTHGLTGYTYNVHKALFDKWKSGESSSGFITNLGGAFANSTVVEQKAKKPWYKEVVTSVKNRFTGKIATEEIVEIDALQFFSNVKASIESSSVYIDRTIPYIKALKMASVSGQTALKETLTLNLVNSKYESVLYAHGLYKVISEDTLVKFYKQAEKGLKLTYISNYGKIIPTDIVEQIFEINKLCVFDNYCILHYDPDGEVYLETEKDKEQERAKRRDPILFGLLSGSNKLYYINDWEDEFCDLSFSDIVDTLGKELVEQDFLKEVIEIDKL